MRVRSLVVHLVQWKVVLMDSKWVAVMVASKEYVKVDYLAVVLAVE